jgi:2-polyprenyl-3-methyl-5-hydroxy-6-metoxy-1,4-benzoquinol methylase
MAERVNIKNLKKILENLDEASNLIKNHISRYLFACSILPSGGTVLDIACGSGYGSKMLADHGLNVISIDISKEAIEFAIKYNGHKRIKWMCEDIKNIGELNFKNLDGIVCFETLEHIESGQEEIIKKFSEILAPLGTAVCSIPLNHPDEIWHKRKFNFKQREELFKNYFSHIEYCDKNKSIIVAKNHR